MANNNATSHRVYSELFDFSNIVRQVCVAQGKNLLIDTLREYFKNDRLYRYTHDAFGFPEINDMTDLPVDIDEERTTRIFIGDLYRYDQRFYPSITVRHSSARYKPVSFNQNYTTKYRLDLITDGYGGRSFVRVPTAIITAGAWEQSFEIKISSESTEDREEIVDIVAVFLQGIARQELYEAGLFVRGVSIGAEQEDEFANDKIFTQSVNIECYAEWRRAIPINDIIETIQFCFQYGVFNNTGDFTNNITDKTIIEQEDNTLSLDIPFPLY